MSGTQPNAQRRRPMVRLTLSPEAWTRVGEIAARRGMSRSAVIEELIRAADMPRPPSTKPRDSEPPAT